METFILSKAEFGLLTEMLSAQLVYHVTRNSYTINGRMPRGTTARRLISLDLISQPHETTDQQPWLCTITALGKQVQKDIAENRFDKSSPLLFCRTNSSLGVADTSEEVPLPDGETQVSISDDRAYRLRRAISELISVMVASAMGKLVYYSDAVVSAERNLETALEGIEFKKTP